MKSILKGVVIIVASLIFASLGAFYMLEKMWEDHERLFFVDEISRNLQNIIDVRSAILIVEASDIGEKERLYKYACHQLRLNTDELKLELYSNPERRNEIKQLKEKAEKIKQRLLEEDKCYE